MKSNYSNQLFDYTGLLEISVEIKRLFPGAKNWFSLASTILIMQTKQRLPVENSYCLKSSAAVFRLCWRIYSSAVWHYSSVVLLWTWVSGKLNCPPGMDSGVFLVICVIIISCDLQVSFNLCLHLRSESYDLSSCVPEISLLSRSDTHSDHPPEIIIVKKFHRIRLLWITACVHVVYDYCSVTLEAGPGARCHVPHVCKDCLHALFTTFLHFNIQ